MYFKQLLAKIENKYTTFSLYSYKLFGMDTASFILISLMAMGASLTQRVCGFGFGIFIMMLLPFIMPSFGEATALSGLLAIFTAMIPAIRTVKNVPWKKLIPILLTFLVTSFFGVLVVKHIDGHILKKVLGAVLILISLYFMFMKGKFSVKPSIGVQIGMGSLSGIMGGLFAMQGPPAVIYFMGCTESKEEYLAITQWYFLIGNCMMTVYRAGHGFVTPCVLEGWAVGMAGVLLGLLIGAMIFKRINPELLRRIIYGFMALSGLIALFS